MFNTYTFRSFEARGDRWNRHFKRITRVLEKRPTYSYANEGSPRLRTKYANKWQSLGSNIRTLIINTDVMFQTNTSTGTFWINSSWWTSERWIITARCDLLYSVSLVVYRFKMCDTHIKALNNVLHNKVTEKKIRQSVLDVWEQKINNLFWTSVRGKKK